jgi:hypothetical protein
MNLCPSCQSCQRPNRAQLFELDRPASAGEVSAAKAWQELEKERSQIEHRRVEQNEPFFVAPQYFAWCKRYTLSGEPLEALQKSLLDGDEDTLMKARQAGFDFAVDFANGQLRPAFALCLRKNPQGKCTEFKRRVDVGAQ